MRARSISVPVVIHGRDTPSTPDSERLLAAHVLKAAEIMRAMAAKEGRVIVVPTLRYEELRPHRQNAVAVIAHARTAPRPGWRKPRKNDQKAPCDGGSVMVKLEANQ